jgi:hypothetical protein
MEFFRFLVALFCPAVSARGHIGESPGSQWLLGTRSALAGVETELTTTGHEGTGTAQDPFMIN